SERIVSRARLRPLGAAYDRGGPPRQRIRRGSGRSRMPRRERPEPARRVATSRPRAPAYRTRRGRGIRSFEECSSTTYAGPVNRGRVHIFLALANLFWAGNYVF